MALEQQRQLKNILYVSKPFMYIKISCYDVSLSLSLFSVVLYIWYVSISYLLGPNMNQKPLCLENAVLNQSQQGWHQKKYDFFIHSIIRPLNHSINNKHKIKTIIIRKNIHSNPIYYNIVIVALTIKSYKIVESFSNDKPLKDNRMHTKFLKCSPSVLGARLFLHDLYYRVPMNI